MPPRLRSMERSGAPGLLGRPLRHERQRLPRRCPPARRTWPRDSCAATGARLSGAHGSAGARQAVCRRTRRCAFANVRKTRPTAIQRPSLRLAPRCPQNNRRTPGTPWPAATTPCSGSCAAAAPPQTNLQRSSHHHALTHPIHPHHCCSPGARCLGSMLVNTGPY